MPSSRILIGKPTPGFSVVPYGAMTAIAGRGGTATRNYRKQSSSQLAPIRLPVGALSNSCRTLTVASCACLTGGASGTREREKNQLLPVGSREGRLHKRSAPSSRTLYACSV